MQIYRDSSEKEYKSELPEESSQQIGGGAAASSGYRVPFEVLGESIVPGLTTVPAIFQGTFVQITNPGPDAFGCRLYYVPTRPFNFGPSPQNVTLNANFIDGDLNVFNFTNDFRNSQQLYIVIPGFKTFIVGIQYAVIPRAEADLTAPAPVGPEALGNRGYINIQTPTNLVTTTIRQVFVKSLAEPTTIISATAYSVPNATLP